MQSLYILIIVSCFVLTVQTNAQTTNESTGDAGSLPYYQIPDYPQTYSAGTVAARMVDGLGFRYYWATEGLRPEDLAFKPNAEARTSRETLDHIYGLTKVIVNATKKIPNTNTAEPEMDFVALRRKTLINIKTAADILRTCSDDDFNDFIIVFEQSNGSTKFPFWNNLNGPIEDAVWHIGQVVSFRRSSGNPFSSKVGLLIGRVIP